MAERQQVPESAAELACAPVAPESVRAALEKILASRGFVNSGRLSRFLRFTVEESLEGRAKQLKEYVVGVEVFERGCS